ncbi:MAG TPA: type II secretion system F family protein [Stellaceae bacterium]|nr:type II secretion system F family protein [Stellaceae bacterium]
MGTFRYSALTAAGARVSGEIDAASEGAAAAELQRSGLFPLHTVPATTGWLAAQVQMLRRRRGPGVALSVTTHELAALLGAGLPLDRALEIVASIAGDKRLAAAFAAVRERVRGGSGLAAALALHPDLFPPLYISLVSAGEAAGALDVALARLAEYLDRAQAVREQIRSALVYPIILLATAGLTLTFVLTRVLPEFAPLLATAGKTLPLSTRIVMGAADLATNWGWLAVMLGLGGWLALRRALAEPGFRRRWDARLLRLPVAGPLIAEAEAGRFARTLGTLLKAGMNLPAALTLARETVGNRAMAVAVADATRDIRAGDSLGALLERSGLFPALAAQLVRVGEATGRLDEMLLHQAGLFERSVARQVERWLAALVPGLTIVLGLVVAAIVGSVLAAILEINNLAG